MMEENEERKEAIKELKYLLYTMPIKPPMECDDKDKWKDNNKKFRTALEYAITSLQEKVPILDKIRAEIMDTGAYEQEVNGNTEYLKGINYCLGVIDKYKAESE